MCDFEFDQAFFYGTETAMRTTARRQQYCLNSCCFSAFLVVWSRILVQDAMDRTDWDLVWTKVRGDQFGTGTPTGSDTLALAIDRFDLDVLGGVVYQR